MINMFFHVAILAFRVHFGACYDYDNKPLSSLGMCLESSLDHVDLLAVGRWQLVTSVVCTE